MSKKRLRKNNSEMIDFIHVKKYFAYTIVLDFTYSSLK